MILLVESNDEYEVDLRAMIAAFFLGVKIRTAKPSDVAAFSKEQFFEYESMITAIFDERSTSIRLEEKGHVLYSAYIYGDYKDRKRFRNKLKLAIYRLLSEYTGRTLPWGSLTGMRPTKIASSALDKGRSRDEILDYYNYTYDTSEEKATLALNVAEKERTVIESVNPLTDYCLYVGIPFCPTRCLYCSFAAYPIMDYDRLVGDYVEALKQELKYISYLNRNRDLIAVYIGGGTPTSLTAKELGSIIECVRENFDLSSLREFTCEAGRPDSISLDKLEIMKKGGVDRISINPQTMNAETLKIIGRAHSPADVKWAMTEAKKAGFRNINMDIILGLQKDEHRVIKPTTQSLYIARDEHGDLMLAPGIPQGKDYSVYDVVDGKFPYKLKDFKYIHFRCSRDQSGSKLLVKLDQRHPYQLVREDYEDTDIVYTHSGTGEEKTYGNRAQWVIEYNIKEIIEKALTAEDQKILEDYKQELIDSGELPEAE